MKVEKARDSYSYDEWHGVLVTHVSSLVALTFMVREDTEKPPDRYKLCGNVNLPLSALRG